MRSVGLLVSRRSTMEKRTFKAVVYARATFALAGPIQWLRKLVSGLFNQESDEWNTEGRSNDRFLEHPRQAPSQGHRISSGESHRVVRQRAAAQTARCGASTSAPRDEIAVPRIAPFVLRQTLCRPAFPLGACRRGLSCPPPLLCFRQCAPWDDWQRSAQARALALAFDPSMRMPVADLFTRSSVLELKGCCAAGRTANPTVGDTLRALEIAPNRRGPLRPAGHCGVRPTAASWTQRLQPDERLADTLATSMLRMHPRRELPLGGAPQIHR